MFQLIYGGEQDQVPTLGSLQSRGDDLSASVRFGLLVTEAKSGKRPEL